MAVKHAGYTAGYAVGLPDGRGWAGDVRPAATYGHAQAIREELGNEWTIYALVAADMDQHFEGMVYGHAPSIQK